jgi:hypothetical protein
LLEALDTSLDPPQLVILRGTSGELNKRLQTTRGRFMPHTHVFAIPEDAVLPPALAAKSMSDSAVAYVCEGLQCSPPISSDTEWDDIIAANTASLQRGSRPL